MGFTMSDDKQNEISPERAKEVFAVTQQVFALLRQSGLHPVEATLALGMTAKAVVLSVVDQATVPRAEAMDNARRMLLDGFNQEFDNPPKKPH